MPAKSAAQQRAAGAALSAKRGKTSASKLKGASRGMYKSMSEKQLDEFASTKRKGKPEHVAKSRTKKSSSRTTARKSPARKSRARKKGVPQEVIALTIAAYCSRTSALSAAPAASVTVRRTKPGPSGSKNSVRPGFIASSGMPFSITVKGGVPPEIFMGSGSGVSPSIAESSRLAPFGGNTICSGRVKLADATA
jgi:hypothetical protein